MLNVLIIGITFGLIYGLVAIGYSLIWQSMSLVHFAQGDLLMVGGFVAVSLIHSGISNILLVLFFVFVTLAVLGGIIQRVAYKRIPQNRIVTRIIATLGISMVLKNAAVFIWGTNSVGLPENFFPGQALQLMGVSIRPVYYWTLIISVCLVIGLVLFLYRTKYGLAVRLTAHNYELAKLMGINPDTYQTVAFMVAIGLTGIAGVLCSPISFISYKMGLAFGVKGFAAAIIGGLDSLPGSIVGGIIIGLIEVFFGRFISGYIEAVLFGIMILVLIIRPQGIFGKAKVIKI
jgi:branched-chain amino acid transport system permease protein